MRSHLFVLALLSAAPTAALAADDKKLPPPIPVVKIDRKEPVAFEKDIEPILINKCQYCHSGSKT